MANSRDNRGHQPEEMRLQKFLSLAGVASRRHAEEMIEAGRVKISGRVVKEMGVMVTPGKSRVEVDNKPVFYSPERTYVLFHKPTECVTTLDDPEGRTTVIDLLPRSMPRVFPVGRLDWDTEGLLLLTNDGELAYRLMHPGSNVPRVYHAKVRGELKDTSAEFKKLQAGIELEDGFAKPDRVSIIDFTGNNTWVEIELHIGRNRIVRRLFDAINFPVMKLRRVSFGNLTLDGLSLGSFRDLNEDEVRALYTMLGEENVDMPSVRSKDGVHYAPGFKPGERMPRQAAPSREKLEARRESGRIDRRPRPGRNRVSDEEESAVRAPRRDRRQFEDTRYDVDENRSFNSDWGDTDRNDRGSRSFDRDDRGSRKFDRDDRGPRSFDRDDRGPRKFDRDDRGPRKFDRDDRGPRSFDRDDRGPRSFDRDDRGPRKFDRDDRGPRKFDRDDRGPRSFDRDDRGPRKFDRDDRGPRKFDRDDRGSHHEARGARPEGKKFGGHKPAPHGGRPGGRR